MSTIEREFLLLPYNNDDLTTDYSDMCLQFGYMTLFVGVLPLIPLLAFISNYLEIRVDGFKLLNNFRRPIPKSAQDIGSWYHVFQTISTISIFTNAAFVFYTGDYFDHWEDDNRLIAGLFYVLAAFVLRSLYDNYYGSTFLEIDIQKKRRSHIIKKLILKIPDDSDFHGR